MTEIHIPYLPSAKFFKVRCRLGVHEQDISSDTDSNPQIRTIGGTVTISASIGRFRYTEADGRSRVIYNKTETYNIQTSTGELFDVDGNLGVNLLDTTSPGIDPQGWTYKATVRPTGGEPFDVNIPESLEPVGTLDLGDGLVFMPSTGITDLETRVKALEDAGPSSGSTTAWNDITDKPTNFTPSEHRHDASEIDNLPSGTTAWADITNKPAVIAAGADAAAARTAIGAGTSNLAIGTTGATAAAGNRQATDTATGMVELATTAEATAGTDTTRAVTPAAARAAGDARYVRTVNGTSPDGSGNVTVSGGGGGGVVIVNPPSTRGIPMGTPIGQSASPLTAGRGRGTLITVPVNIVVTRITIAVQTASTGAGLARLALYRIADPVAAPYDGSDVRDAGTVDISTVGEKTATFGVQQTLSAGVWMVVVASDVNFTLGCVQVVSAGPVMWMPGLVTNNWRNNIGVQSTGAPGVGAVASGMPASILLAQSAGVDASRAQELVALLDWSRA